MIKKILQKAFEQKTLIGITTKEVDWEESSIGFILEINEDSFILDEIDEFGIAEGKTVIEIKEVIYAISDDWYLRKLQQVYDNKSLFDPSRGVKIWKGGEEAIPYIKELKDNKKIARFYFEDKNSEINYVIGMVLDVDDQYFLVKNIGGDGSIEGITCYRIQDLIKLRYDDLGEQKVNFLLHNPLPPFSLSEKENSI